MAGTRRKFIVGALTIILAFAGLFWWARNSGQVKEIVVINGQVTVIAAPGGFLSPEQDGVAYRGVLKKLPQIPATPKPSDKRKEATSQPAPQAPPPCRVSPQVLASGKAASPGAGGAFGDRMLSLPGPKEAAWLSAEARRAGIAGFCAEYLKLCPQRMSACFLARSRVIAMSPDTPIKLIMREIARAMDENYSLNCPYRRASSYRKSFMMLGERFDKQFIGRRMKNAIAYDLGLPNPNDGNCIGKPPDDFAKKWAKDATRNKLRAPPPCKAKPRILPAKRGRAGFLTPAKARWFNAQARRANIAGFCLEKDVKEICSPYASACFLGKSRVIVLRPNASILTLLHEIAHAMDIDYSLDCPHRHGLSYQKNYVRIAKLFDRRFPGGDQENAVIREIQTGNPDYYKCHWTPKS